MLRGSRALGVFLAVLAFLFTLVAGATAYAVVTNYQHVGNLLRVVQLIKTDYNGEQVSAGEMVEGAIGGIVQSLEDPYSEYMDHEEYTRFREQIKGSFGGIGVLVGMRSQGLVVNKPYEGTPADTAGIQAGDIITEIDGVSIVGSDLESAVALIHGPIGSKVRLVVYRDGNPEPLEFTLVREEITAPSVDHRFLDGGIGHIAISQFSEQTPLEMEQALNELLARGIQGLVLDLRHNPGGNLQSAVQVSDVFVGEEPIVYVNYRSGKEEVFTGEPQQLGLPLVVIVDQDSASAAEIVAGAVKDTGTGTLVGTTTYGKGVVQSLFELEGETGLKLTTARYLTPKRYDLHMKGIKPDVVVEQPPGSDTDVQLEKALEVLKEKM